MMQRVTRLIQSCVVLVVLLVMTSLANAAPYAALVMDARTGKILHSRNADTRLHPASLTKMMTLYIAFEAVERGEISLDTYVTISSNAANEEPSKLGLRAGQKIRLRYLIRAAAVKSANDAATAIAEAISGSEAAFASRMNRTAVAMGMNNTRFKNAHGLTQVGHYSTARDMSVLGRHMIYDYPEYYNLFSRRSTDAGVRTVNNTNRRLLNAYAGADGIKTGYTRAAGYNLVASAERGNERIIATVFGGRSGAWRNARVAELLDMGFSRAPTHVRARAPERPRYGTTVRTMTAVKESLRPVARPFGGVTPANPAVVDSIVAEVARGNVVVLEAVVTDVAESNVAEAPATPTPVPTVAPVAPDPNSPNWGVHLGQYPSRHQAERVLVRMALSEMVPIEGTERNIERNGSGYDALFTGLSYQNADRTCRRLQAQQFPCVMVAPQG